MITRADIRRMDPVLITAAVLVVIGAAFTIASIVTALAGSDSGSAIPRQPGDYEEYGSLVVNSWIILLIGGLIGVCTIVPLVIALVSRQGVRLPLALGVLFLLCATALTIIVDIDFISDRDAVAFGLDFSTAFYLVLVGILSWLAATILMILSFARGGFRVDHIDGAIPAGGEPGEAPPVKPAPGRTFCTGCGRRLDPGAHFCAVCGTAVPETED